MSAHDMGGATTHGLKVWPEFFAAILDGRKTFEVRRCDDRDFAVGDALWLREWSQADGYTGREVARTIGYIVSGAPFLPDGLAVLGFADDAQRTRAEAAEAEVARLRRQMEHAVPWRVSDPPTDEEMRAIRWRWASGPERYQADADALIAGVMHARVEVARLGAALAAVLPFQNCNGHGHGHDGVWDADNGGGRANRPCVKCHAFADAREAIGRPRWPSPESIAGIDAGEHGDGCGCGGPRR